MAFTTPSCSTPGICRSRPLATPTDRKTASKPSCFSSLRPKPGRSGVPSFRVTPNSMIFSTSAWIKVRGKRYSGMPKRIMPPGSFRASKTVT